MDKTFLEFLETQNPTQLIYVATEKGTNWMFIDTAGNLILNMKSNDKLVKDRANKHLDMAKRRFDSISLLYEEVNDKLIFSEDENEKKELEKAITKIHLRLKQAIKFKKRQELVIKMGKKDLKDRKIISIYEHKTDPIGPCVILEGYDNGSYWFIEETYTHNTVDI